MPRKTVISPAKQVSAIVSFFTSASIDIADLTMELSKDALFKRKITEGKARARAATTVNRAAAATVAVPTAAQTAQAETETQAAPRKKPGPPKGYGKGKGKGKKGEAAAVATGETAPPATAAASHAHPELTDNLPPQAGEGDVNPSGEPFEGQPGEEALAEGVPTF